MSSVLDFVGRKSDLLVFQGDFATGRKEKVQLTLSRSGEGGLLATGVQKLAQRVLMILLTKKGSMRYRPDIGTTFMIQADRGMWRTQSDVILAFTSAKLDLVRQLRAEQQDTDPADEKLQSLNIVGIGLNVDSVRLTLSMTTEAGSNYQFIAPIRVPTK